MWRVASTAEPGLASALAVAASLTRRAVIFLIDIYRAVFSPLITSTIGPACRFEPTCSDYARESISRHGIVSGGRLALGRLLRCRPGGGWGPDPVPQDRLPSNRAARALT